MGPARWTLRNVRLPDQFRHLGPDVKRTGVDPVRVIPELLA